MPLREVDKLNLLRQVTFFRTFDDAQLQRVSILAHEVAYAKGEYIFYQDDPGDCLFIMVSGYVRIYLSSQNGDEVTFRVYGSGDTFGEFALLDGKPRTAGAKALSNVVTLTLYRDGFFQLMRLHFSMVERVIEDLVERLRFTTTFAQNLAFLSATGRVAAMLVQLAEREAKGSGPVQIKITQGELAHAIGATREWINKALHSLADQQNPLILTERGAITVLDRERLQLWADSKERRGQERESAQWTKQAVCGGTSTHPSTVGRKIEPL